MNTLRTRKACKDIDLELIQVYADSALENSIKNAFNLPIF